MKNIIFGILCLVIFNNEKITAQADIWQKLSMVTYKKEYNDLLGYKIDVPVFDKIIKNLEGKTITVRGYIVPTDGYKSHTEFVFSAFPYSMCFFCGQAGPETVMDVKAIEGIKYTSEPVTIRGKLHLNDKDINRLMFSISGAELVE
jgi:hypothetical protein